MKLARRAFLRLAAGVAVLPALPRVVLGAAYPSRPVHIVVGFTPGSAADIVARLVGERLSERLGQPFVIENRPGAGGTVGADAVVRASPDGYTLLLCSSADVINATLHDNLGFNFIRDIAPVASIAHGPLVLVIPPSFPAKTVPEFITYAKANPGKVNFGSAGIGSVVQLAAELFKVRAGVDMVHVPYRGMAPALTDLIAGRVQAVFSTLPPAIKLVKAGKLRPLAVTSTARFAALPDLPTVGDFLPGYEATLVLGVGAPKSVPADIVGRLNKEINTTLADAKIKARLASLGMVPTPMTSSDFGNLLAKETERWGGVIKSAGIKPKA